jgi:hypothetical protein
MTTATETKKPSPKLLRILQSMNRTSVRIVIQRGTVDLECDIRDLALMNKFDRQLTEAHRREILAVFGPGDQILDRESLQEWLRPLVVDRLSRFWPDLVGGKHG